MRDKRLALELLRGQLITERTSFIGHWNELSAFIKPRRARFVTTDVNRGGARSNKIIDSTATYAARTLSSGMMSGVTSPARPWFRLTTTDPDLSEDESVKEWLRTVQQRMIIVFLKSNLYQVLPTFYSDLGIFATAAMLVQEDPDTVIRCFSFPVGSYALANDDKLRTRVFMREFQMTVRQIVKAFGGDEKNPDWTNISAHVKKLWDNKSKEIWIPVVHMVLPNDEADETKADAKFKRFKSVYFEAGESSKLLKESGFDDFPILAGRWEVTGEDVYGTDCPGMTALGDIKQLQAAEKLSLQAIEKMVKPPMTGPTAMKNSKASILPGDITYVDAREGQGGFRPAHEVRFSINEVEMKNNQVRDRINKAFFADLFLMLAYSDENPNSRQPVTATEINERHEEKLLALGPVLEQLNQDLLDPLIERTYNIMEKQGLIPEPPQILQGKSWSVEYISIMAQAQKVVGLASLDRFSSFLEANAQTDPTIYDAVNRDEMVRDYGEGSGVNPKILNTQATIDATRKARAQAAQAKATAETALTASNAAKNLSQTDTQNPNGLTDLMTGLGGQQGVQQQIGGGLQ